jgi:hypothetical protein
MTAILRIGLALFAAIELTLGIWTSFFPENFYDSVPTVNLTPPFSEHLMRDFGGASLGIGVVLAAASIWPTTKLAIIALVAYLAFSLPHLVFHAEHVEGATATQAGILLGLLGASVIGPLALTVVAIVRERRASLVPLDAS